MPTIPALKLSRRLPAHCDGSVTFAVYAPLGTDPILSVYPDTVQRPIAQQALLAELDKVAACGVNVSALVDLYQDDTWLVEIPANRPGKRSIVSAWKQDMSAPQALAGFLRRAHQRFPRSSLVLSLEGHGGAYVPDVDPNRITTQSMTNWSQGGQSGQVHWVRGPGGSSYEAEGGSPALPMTSPELPMTSPELPAARMPLSSWGTAEALRLAIAAGVPRPAVVNFANCFNASFEHLHAVAPYADFATGYANYDFYTACATYPAVFQRLRQAGSASALQLARWFALENQVVLDGKRNHPTVGATVPLARMKRLAGALDDLAAALSAELRGAPDRAAVRDAIAAAAKAAQQYDTDQNMDLEVPDQFMDLASFARALGAQPRFAGRPVAALAAALRSAMTGLHQYGSYDRPYTDETQIWDFRDTDLALSVFFPDPALQGLWDWRSPYYLAGKVDPVAPPPQRHQIDFLADRAGGQRAPWVQFIVDYHDGVPFKGLLPALAPFFPTFNAKFKNELPHPEQTPVTGRPPKSQG